MCLPQSVKQGDNEEPFSCTAYKQYVWLLTQRCTKGGGVDATYNLILVLTKFMIMPHTSLSKRICKI